MVKLTDKHYWEKYYGCDLAPHEPSPFATYIMSNFLKTGDRLIELGCGNGRDAIFFAQNGVKVIAVDQSKNGIEKLQKRIDGFDIKFKTADFCSLKKSKNKFSVVYSRFTLHAISSSQQKDVLLWTSQNLQDGGLIAIEVRGFKNELYGLGKSVDGEPDAFIYNNHYRRFVNFDQLIKQLNKLGFEIIKANEDTGFAPFNDTDYHFIRVIARKTSQIKN